MFLCTNYLPDIIRLQSSLYSYLLREYRLPFVNADVLERHRNKHTDKREENERGKGENINEMNCRQRTYAILVMAVGGRLQMSLGSSLETVDRRSLHFRSVNHATTAAHPGEWRERTAPPTESAR